jgi:peptidoglycan/LPS O-acetylase OafA/YrhL
MKKYIPSLNGLRAIVIIIVILCHANFRILHLNIPYPLNILVDGYLGVNVFFVISGFLITKLLIEEENNNDGRINLKNFYFRRMFRIFPAYYFLLGVYFLLQLLGVLYFTKTSWFSSVFYCKYILGSDWESGHFWSLSVEEHFYLVWPLVFMFFKKARIPFAFLIILLVFFFRLNIYNKWLPFPLLYNQLTIFLRADALMIGCLFALYEKKIISLTVKYANSILHPLVILAAFLIVSAPYLIQLNMEHHLHLGSIFVPLYIGNSTGTLSNILVALLVIVSINNKGIWFNFVNMPVMNYLGKLSYSLYLWQQLFFSTSIGVFGKLPFNLIYIFIAANFSYYIIEKPFLKFKANYENKRPNAEIVLATT